MSSLFDQKPGERVLKIFEEIASIPRPSYKEKAISEYVIRRCKEKKLDHITDKDNNVITKLPATKGYEDDPVIILQAHMDMVCEKTDDCTKDMEKEGVDLVLEEDTLSAKGTTLGGDDGIGVAMMLAIMEDDELSHPALELVFTTSEEVGMDGAKSIDKSGLSGRILINLDSEKEGEILTGCAGGGRVNIRLPLDRGDKKYENGYALRTVRISGLKGGHSGDEINKGRANATRILTSLLAGLSEKYDIGLVSINGGSKDNAIPRLAQAVIAIPQDIESDIIKTVSVTESGTKGEYHGADPDIRYELTEYLPSGTEAADISKIMSPECTKKVIALILSLPNGVMRMSDDIDGLVETSLNLGVTETTGDTLHLGLSVRSSVGSAYEALRDQLLFIAKEFDADTEVTGEYPAWEYAPVSPIRDKAVKLYREMYGEEMQVRAIHAGLECGLFAAELDELTEKNGLKLPKTDAISMGPDLFDVHTPDEHLSISSVARVYDYLTKLIALH